MKIISYLKPYTLLNYLYLCKLLTINKGQFKKTEMNFKNIIILIKHLRMNQILAWDNT